MIEKFANNKMSEKEVDAMMYNFYKQDDELKFKKKWSGIIKENLKTEKRGLLFSINRRLFSVVSAASIVIIFGFISVYFYTNGTTKPNNYSTSTKGVNNNYLKLNQLIKNQKFVSSANFSSIENSITDKFNNKKYKNILSEIDALVVSDKVISNRMLFIGGISATKELKYDKAISYFKKINKDSEFHQDAIAIIDLINRLD